MILVMVVNACKSEIKETKENNFLTGQRSILGQKPPDLIPIPFAPGIVTSAGWEYGGVFSPDMKEFYFLRKNERIKEQEFVVFKNEGGKWNETVISNRQGQPFVSPNGQTLHLGGRFKERNKNGTWSKIKKLQTPFDNLPIMRLTASSKGTYFFDEFKQDYTGDIRYSRLIEGKYEEPKLLSKKINTGRSFHPFIAPDESYLIFDSYREDGYGSSDIYISYREDDGTWGEPINLGNKINTAAWEASATVTPDGKYLFFNRIVGPEEDGNVDIFWVDTHFIEVLKLKN
ncbi:hypothetical protein [Marixanthomonas sp. SCSIO 43207]|uniref:TolB family protein n=1 Tax=Marixanthomonas sp. SCSIO 43207 TaxID=2779360 RepID=UPI001CA95DF8|nr:hypothetical protein [Marixanthomonas sp. SCSIO 43207]